MSKTIDTREQQNGRQHNTNR
uniref:Uncharacterized protein n=1 Tax=Arundo donax TaxID=35708 RepID=A0A0A9U0V7_ARUDO